VIGVMMPCGGQKDIGDSVEVCNLLGIKRFIINIGEMYRDLRNRVMLVTHSEGVNSVFSTNTPARLRMTTLYAVAALYPNSRVVNTCNRSEDYVGYSTKYGDAAGDFSPLGNLTVREVLEIGDELGLPKRLVHKAPSDGMCGKTDEDNLGFTYEQLDDYILGTGAVDEEVVEKIERLHKATRHKYSPMPMFAPAEGGIIDPNQLTLFDYSKQENRYGM
jgi:NAD+ synthase